MLLFSIAVRIGALQDDCRINRVTAKENRDTVQDQTAGQAASHHRSRTYYSSSPTCCCYASDAGLRRRYRERTGHQSPKRKSRRGSRRLFFHPLSAGSGAALLKEREPSQPRMPLLANLLLNRKAGGSDGRVHRASFDRFRIYGPNQMIDGRLFSYVPSPFATSRQGGFGIC